MVNNNLAFRNAVSVFYRFSMRYCGFGYPPMSRSTVTVDNVIPYFGVLCAAISGYS